MAHTATAPFPVAVKEASPASQCSSRLCAGIGLSAAGAGLLLYASRSWKDSRTHIFQALPKFQRKGTYVATAALTLMMCGAELLVAECSTVKAANDKMLDDMLDAKPYTPFQEDVAYNSAASWYTRPSSREGATVALWLGLNTLAADRAGHLGAFQYSSFRQSPLWTRKMMLPSCAGEFLSVSTFTHAPAANSFATGLFCMYMFMSSFEVKVDEYLRQQQESKGRMQNLIWRAQESTLRAQQPARYVGKWRG